MFRVTLRSLLSRKLRLVLSGLAVVLGVMAVSGALVVSETIGTSFDVLFSSVNQNVDVKVTGPTFVDADTGGQLDNTPIPAAVVDQVAAMSGVDDARGSVAAPGAARAIGHDGKVVISRGPPSIGAGWDDGALNDATLRKGRAPHADDEIAINATIADRGDFRVGERVGVLTLEPKRTFTVVGIFGYSGGRDSRAGESEIRFTMPVAQRLVLGRAGAYSAVDVRAADGVSARDLRDRIRTELGSGYTVRTGDQVAADQAKDSKQFVSVIRSVLLGFAGIALFVGAFLIINTFSILVAQRTRELALLRSVGAGRGQVTRSVLVEAGVVALIASSLGLLAGLGVAALLKQLMQKFSGAQLPVAGLIVPASAVIAAYTVGILVTLAAALVPAVRAARVPPVAALRDASTPDRPLTRITVAGTAAVLCGAGAIGAALATGADDAALWLLLGGVLLSFVGVAMVTPAISTVVVPLIGRALSWSAAGAIGWRNSARNPRRTAITASALMVGMALVAGTGVLASSLKASAEETVRQDLRAQLVIDGVTLSRFPGTYDPAVIDQVRGIDGVADAVVVYTDSVQVGSSVVPVAAADLPRLATMLSLHATAGTLRTLSDGQVAVDDKFAIDHKLSTGDTVQLATSREAARPYQIAAVYERSSLVPGVMMPESARSVFRTVQASQGYIMLKDGMAVAPVQRKIEALLEDNPEVGVANQSEFLDQEASDVDTIVALLYLLVGLAVVIAVLGIINTLALSVFERTRELGLVRAVGMQRRGVAGLVVAESVVIAVFGALLGMVVGSGLGVAAVRALRDQGIPTLALPWTTLGVLVGLSVLAGVVAALLPAVRASRVNVLHAIAYE